MRACLRKRRASFRKCMLPGSWDSLTRLPIFVSVYRHTRRPDCSSHRHKKQAAVLFRAWEQSWAGGSYACCTPAAPDGFAWANRRRSYVVMRVVFCTNWITCELDSGCWPGAITIASARASASMGTVYEAVPRCTLVPSSVD